MKNVFTNFLTDENKYKAQNSDNFLFIIFLNIFYDSNTHFNIST